MTANSRLQEINIRSKQAQNPVTSSNYSGISSDAPSLTPRQTMILNMQHTQGNRAVLRMLGIQHIVPCSIQREQICEDDETTGQSVCHEVNDPSSPDNSSGADNGSSLADSAQQDYCSNHPEAIPCASAGDNPQQSTSDGCDSLTPSTNWELNPYLAVSEGEGAGVIGVYATLNDLSPNGCEHHASFIGVGPSLGGKGKFKNKPISIDGPGAVPFTCAPMTYKDFNGGGRMLSAGIHFKGLGWAVERIQFSAMPTSPEWLNIGGFELGAGASIGAFVGRWIVT